MYKAQRNLPFRKIENLDFPKIVQVQTVSYCNGRCIMCPYFHVHDKLSHGQMSDELYKKVIDECANHDVAEFKPFLMNEPLLDNKLCNRLVYARLKLPKAKIGFSTNGVLLNEKIANELCDTQLDELWFNFSGNTAATYNKVMRGLDFDTVRNNIINFSKLAAQKGSKMSINISMVEIKDNIPEIDDSINFWKDYNVSVHPIPYNNRGGNSDEINIKVLDNVIGRRVCDKPTNKICILYNGEVVLCPSERKRKNILGDVSKSTIKDVWNSDERRRYINYIMNCEYERIELSKNCDFPLLYKE